MSSLQIRLRIERPRNVVFHWYSARLRFAILTDREGLERYFDSVMLLRAESRDAAFARALELGREREQHYRNEEGVGVQWRLASIMSLDQIAAQNLNGAEVLGTTVEADAFDRDAFQWDHAFKPELSVPAETC